MADLSRHDKERARVIAKVISGELSMRQCILSLRPIAKAEHRETLKRRRALRIEREERERVREEQAQIRKLGDELRERQRQERRRIRRYEEVSEGA